MNKLFFISCVFFVLGLVFFSSGEVEVFDSDRDGVSDDYDRCLGTNSKEGLPIILRNSEFLGCSCSQIFNLMNDNYCLDIYCFPNKPLEIRERDYSARPNPCPPARCDGFDLVEFVTEPISCNNGVEAKYTCREVITENAEVCLNNDEDDLIVDIDESVYDDDFYDLVVSSYLEDSVFLDLFSARSKLDLIDYNEEVLKRVNIERVVNFSSRVINNREIFFADIYLIVEPDNYFFVDDFILVERILGDLSSRNIVIQDEYFFDESNNLIVWRVPSLKERTIFSYRITPSDNLDFDFIVQGDVNNSVFLRLILPILLVVLLIGFVVFWIIHRRDEDVWKK
ncbi:MAG: hypothetical protein ACLFN8_00055 [Candidatus Woesearchaeota archaeon]